ncbi:MAG: transglycosylase SLT domain-containing protein [Prevotella sp.]|nr:transglycosylase SLT domain-containing protein [Prevotella sp.]
MNRLMKIVCVSLTTLLLLSATPVQATAKKETKSAQTSSFNWAPVMEAIIQVESEGNPRAVSGNSVGAMQITPILVKDCNNILEKRKSKVRYTLADRYNVAKSKEMFLLFQSHYNPTNDVEKAIRLWNGGIRYTIKGTNNYYRKVMRQMK